jgi:hypothetical protein
VSSVYWIDDPREPERSYDRGLCCPNGISEADWLYIQSYGTQNLTVRACTRPSAFGCECPQPFDAIGWAGHLAADGLGPGPAQMWCANEAGISEVIDIVVPEPGPVSGLLVGIAVLVLLARVWNQRGRR